MSSRRHAPTILLTAVVATMVILPWASDSRPSAPAAAATRLSQHPLTAPGPGVSVREVGQAEPFSMVALTSPDLAGSSARVRAKRADGSWGPWYRIEHEAEHETDRANSGPDGTEPVFVGKTTAVQIELTRPTDTPAPSVPITSPTSTSPVKPGLGYLPATAERPFAQNISAILISPPKSPIDAQWTPPTAVPVPGQPPSIIPRGEWGAPASSRCGSPSAGGRIRAAVVHHTAGSNDYAPEDSAQIVRSIYAYHTRTLGWCDIGYNALVDKYGQVFEGRAGGIAKPVLGSHAGGFNRDTWGVSMLGSFDQEPPPPLQIHTVGRLLGWRLGLDHDDPLGDVALASAGGSYTFIARGTTLTLPTIFSHRDVDKTECPGAAAYAAMDEIRDVAAHFYDPPDPEALAKSLEGGAIYARWRELGGPDSYLGVPMSAEADAEGAGEIPARYALFDHGAIYWSPPTGAQPVTGAIYDAWAALGYERGLLGLPTSAEFQEPEWIGQNFAHGVLNFNRLRGTVTLVADGVGRELPLAEPDEPLVQLERFSPVVSKTG